MIIGISGSASSSIFVFCFALFVVVCSFLGYAFSFAASSEREFKISCLITLPEAPFPIIAITLPTRIPALPRLPALISLAIISFFAITS